MPQSTSFVHDFEHITLATHSASLMHMVLELQLPPIEPGQTACDEHRFVAEPSRTSQQRRLASHSIVNEQVSPAPMQLPLWHHVSVAHSAPIARRSASHFPAAQK
jgi:hypothetical protein